VKWSALSHRKLGEMLEEMNAKPLNLSFNACLFVVACQSALPAKLHTRVLGPVHDMVAML